MRKLQPVLRIDLQSTTAVYRQIVDSLRASLVERELCPGELLPSVRTVAIELGVTLSTVAQAYRILSDEGWLDLKHGRRAIVLDRRIPSNTRLGTVAEFQRGIRQLIAQMRSVGLSKEVIASELRRAATRLEH